MPPELQSPRRVQGPGHRQPSRRRPGRPLDEAPPDEAPPCEAPRTFVARLVARLIAFEHSGMELLSHGHFALRMLRSFGITLIIVGGSLAFGSAGYHYLGGLSWIDSLLDAAMILTGMGPVHQQATTAGKLFAVFYALYSGIAFLSMTAVILAPVLHRFMHHFHLGEDEEDARETARGEPSAATVDRSEAAAVR